MRQKSKLQHEAVADPGFPVGGGVHPLGGGWRGPRHGHFSVKMYAKMKELGPIGGGRALQVENKCVPEVH